AQGIIDCARRHSVLTMDGLIEFNKRSRSPWPGTKIPSEKVVEKWAKWHDEMSDEERGLNDIYSSVRSEFSDFSRYVVGDLDEWTSVRLGTAPTKTVKEQVADFASQLRPALRKALKEFETLTRNAELCRQISPEERKQILQVELTDSDWKALIE